jgi:hypothetical protein
LFWIERFQYSVVFSESVIGVPNKVFAVLIYTVVMGVSAGIATEFFIDSAHNFITTF